ncbi:MAG: abortive infection system antitoxin AbiGi family protein [Polyangia bacterium]
MARPGTVSKILWHFPGGPTWDKQQMKQSECRKPDVETYKALCGILDSKELRLGRYQEVVNWQIPEIDVIDMNNTPAYSRKKNYPATQVSAPVCCLADIPIQHIDYHADRYGCFAIGFRREAAIEKGKFNPVLYTLDSGEISRLAAEGEKYLGLARLFTEQFREEVVSLFDELEKLGIDAVGEVLKRHGIGTRFFSDRVIVYHNYALDRIEGLLPFLKTFAVDEFDTIYCEREWRSVSPFRFDADDVAMVVLPRGGKPDYFEDFLGKAEDFGIHRGIPVVPWEDLIEH